MKTGLTIQQMAQELLRQSKAKQDYLVNTGSLSLSVTTDAPQLRVTENGLDMPPWAMRMGRNLICAAGWSLRRNSLLLTANKGFADA